MVMNRSEIRNRIEIDIECKKYNTMNDVLFKFIFGKEERKQITMDFLNAVLGRSGGNAIQDIQFRNTEIAPNYEDDKLTRLDIFCITESGEQIDVEVQITDHKNMERRTLFYWSQMYLYDFSAGQDYKELKPSITINILRYHLLPQESPHAMYGIYNTETMHRLNKDLELHFLEVPKFQKKPVKDMTKIERWIAYFSNKLNAEEMEELAMSEAAIQNAMDAACVSMQNQEERLAYINRQIAILDYESDKRAWIEEAEKRGEERGEKRGERRGRDAERESFLYKMIRQGYDDEAIHALTLFPMEDIRSARMNFHKK